jgi:uncharacterized protein YigE (DUF2233 family)
MRALFVVFLVLGGCGNARTAPAPDVRSACNQQLFEGDRFTVCDPGSGELKLFAAGPKQRPLRSFAEIGGQVTQERVAFAMNAGMFDDAGRPIGLAIAEGRQLHAINRREGGGNFHLMPNGVFLVRARGKAEVVTSAAFRPSKDIALATQSGPMLVIAGKLHPKFEPDGRSRYIRNGVGVTRHGKALFVISEDPVSFGKFARFFRDALKAPDALFFDGSVSALWDPANGRQDSHAELGPIIVALKPSSR